MRLDKARIKRILRFRSERAIGRGKGVQRIIAIIRAKAGADTNRICAEVAGRIGSLINSFTPSAIG